MQEAKTRLRHEELEACTPSQLPFRTYPRSAGTPPFPIPTPCVLSESGPNLPPAVVHTTHPNTNLPLISSVTAVIIVLAKRHGSRYALVQPACSAL